MTFLQAQLARQRGDLDRARQLVRECLDRLPGHHAFQEAAIEIGTPLPKRAQKIIESRQRAELARD